MGADEGLQVVLAGQIEEKGEAVEAVGIGQGEMGEGVRLRRGADLFNRVGAAAE
ncbi:MAG: hypothetical protein BWY77_01238 [bacterium ADurb.Bin431]|nr:MAG: hypothetical protein BWY77_01238 [bacterium ADurb.Bin431]